MRLTERTIGDIVVLELGGKIDTTGDHEALEEVLGCLSAK